MRRFTVHLAVWSLAALLFVVLTFEATTSSQSNRKRDEDAARKNTLSLRELSWTFGSKPQRGWYLYLPLIKKLIKTKDDPSSPKFAAAVARWQAKSGRNPSGVLDDETLYAMIGVWQSARLKDRNVAPPEQLLTAPISDFYDASRAEELRQVERRTYAAYKRMVAAAVAERSLGLARTRRGELATNEKFLKIISAYRSPAYQEKLRRESPNSGTAGLAVNSPHFTGRALDLYVGGEPVDTQDPNRALQVQTRVYQWLVQNAERFGFRPYCYEPWHWEFVK
ncbi:MAG TPA: M15 family metallopeptidase [Pyrinomonadaceae bacterium]|nr:M15 family metallopeptidase [Pyrinomonadaceae bacterium]